MSTTKRREKGSGTIVERANGSFALVLDAGKDPETGKRRRRWLSGKTKAEVRRKAADLKARTNGAITAAAKGTLNDFMETWIEHMRGRISIVKTKTSIGPNTFVGYEGAWRLHAAPLIGAMKLDAFGPDDVERLYARLKERGTSPSIVFRVNVVLHIAFTYAIRKRKYAFANPFAVERADSVPKTKHPVLEAEEARRFLKAARGDRLEALWVLLLLGGLRLGEALALRWSDVHSNPPAIAIERSFVEVRGRVETGNTKNSSSRRFVAIGPLIVAALRKRKKAAELEGHGSSLIFSTTVGTPMRQSNLRRSHFTPIRERACVPKIRIHDLRHTSASLALLGGVAAKTVSERLGHSTTRLTLDRYSHLIGDLQAGASEAIEDALAGRRTGRSSKSANRR